MSVEDILQHRESGIGRPQLDVNVDVTGGVIVYSEPPSHSKTVLVGPWGVDMNVHRKHFQDLTFLGLCSI